MKKILTLMLAVLVCASVLTSCKGKNNDSDVPDKDVAGITDSENKNDVSDKADDTKKDNDKKDDAENKTDDKSEDQGGAQTEKTENSETDKGSVKDDGKTDNTQKPAGTKPAEKPVQTPVTKPAETKPAEKPVQKPAESKPAETKPAESKPSESKPAEKPAETPVQKPAESKPAETKPAESKPSESKPAEKPAETPVQKPAESKPAESKPETKPDENTKTDENKLSSMKLDEIITKIYEKVPLELSLVSDYIDISDENALKYNTGLTDSSKISEVCVSEPMIGSIPYSLVLVKVKNASDASDIASQMKSGINQRKWVCVEADDLAVTYSGDVVLLFMVGSEYNDDVKSSDITAAFEALA